MEYPNDDTGDVLRRLSSKGDDLSKPRDINFSVVFSSAEDADAFTKAIQSRAFRVSTEHTGGGSDFPWDVTVVRNMSADYDEITRFEEELQAIADISGGHNDGWGCFTQNSTTLS